MAFNRGHVLTPRKDAAKIAALTMAKPEAAAEAAELVRIGRV